MVEGEEGRELSKEWREAKGEGWEEEEGKEESKEWREAEGEGWEEEEGKEEKYGEGGIGWKTDKDEENWEEVGEELGKLGKWMIKQRW